MGKVASAHENDGTGYAPYLDGHSVYARIKVYSIADILSRIAVRLWRGVSRPNRAGVAREYGGTTTESGAKINDTTVLAYPFQAQSLELRD